METKGATLSQDSWFDQSARSVVNTFRSLYDAVFSFPLLMDSKLSPGGEGPSDGFESFESEFVQGPSGNFYTKKDYQLVQATSAVITLATLGGSGRGNIPSKLQPLQPAAGNGASLVLRGSYSPEFTTRLQATYRQFKAEGVTMTEHALKNTRVELIVG